ncbi:MAG: hypothetical protein ACTHJQ_01505 [Rhizobiaceae bacterium]
MNWYIRSIEARIEAERQKRIADILFLLWLIEECRASIALSDEED